jgi:hypothetical protein
MFTENTAWRRGIERDDCPHGECRMPGRRSLGLRIALFFLLLPVAARSSTANLTCKKLSDFRIVSPGILLLQCSDAFTRSDKPLEVRVLLSQDLAIVPAGFDLELAPYPQDSNWVIATTTTLSGEPAPAIKPGQKFTVALIDPGPPEKLVTKLDIDTSPVAAITQDIIPRSFILSTHNALVAPASGSVTIGIHNFDRSETPAQSAVSQAGPVSVDVPIDPASSAPLQNVVTPDSLGDASFTLRHAIIFRSQVAFDVTGLQDVLGQQVKPKPTDRVKVGQAPTTKALSTLYVKGDWVAGSGAKPAWVLEGRLAPMLFKPVAGWRFFPDLETDIGNNTIANIKYSDSVDFGFSVKRDDNTPALSRSIQLQHVTTTAGFDFETDKELDRDNALGDANFLFRFAHLYEQQAAARSSILAAAKKEPYNQGYDVKTEDLRTPAIGYELDFSLFTEDGSAIKDTTAKATTGGATILVPSYSIARLGPQIDGVLELWNLSFNAKALGRYLFTEENTVHQLKNNSLILVPVNGWQGYGEVDANWNIDPTKHLALNVTYKNGSIPPTFIRVNCVQAGLLLKF